MTLAMESSTAMNLARRFLSLPPEKAERFANALREEGVDPASLPIPAAGSGAPRTCGASPAQQRLWFLWRLQPESTAYTMVRAVRLKGRLSREAVQSTFDALVERHESLRTRFEFDGAELLQRIDAAGRMNVRFIDLAGDDTAADARERRAQEIALSEESTPFDLEAGPLWRVALLAMGERDHVMIVCLSHAICDGWSMGTLLDEFTTLYNAYAGGTRAALPPLRIQYADFAVWQKRWLAAGELSRQLDYWTRTLADAPPPPALPLERKRIEPGAEQGATLEIPLDAKLSARLNALALECRVTPFVLLMASFKALLRRYTGENDIRVGVPVANRSRTEIEPLIGFFVNMLVIRSDIVADVSFVELLQAVNRSVIEAQSCQDVPYDAVVDAVNPSRSLTQQPLFQVVHNHEMRKHDGSAVLLGLEAEPFQYASRVTQFDLILNTQEWRDGSASGLRAFFTYRADLFERPAIERFARHWLRLLDGVVRNPHASVGSLPIMDDAEVAAVLSAGAPKQLFPGESSLAALFEAQAAANPSAIALSDAGRCLTYAELNTRANEIAHRLIALGVQPESRVGLALERSTELVIGMLGILKAGGAYVPLDPAYPQERLEYLVKDSGVSLVLTQPSLLPKLPPVARVQWLVLETTGQEQHSGANPIVPVHPDNLAYVIYTSGSTGRPKGAQLTHRNVVRLLQASQEHFQFGAQDVWTLFHSYAFDFSVWEIFGALCYGGRLVIVPYAVSRTPGEFAQLLRRERVTVLNQTPSAFSQLLQAPELYEEPLPLRYVVFGGEALNPQVLKPWLRKYPQSPWLINMYGITETTVHVTYRPIVAADLQSTDSPIGPALADLGLRILDERLNPVPVGVAGELHVTGAGLARGYLNRAPLSAERFVADPYSATGERMYRTGDRVRWTSSGGLEYLGRLDEQVKIRGFRIELGEVQGCLLQRPEVAEAVVIVDEAEGHARLVAYVSGTPASVLDPAMLREQLLLSLPEHMVPAAVVVLDKLPLTSNGKVDRRALPRPTFGGGSKFEAPQGELEQAIAEIWGQTLGVAQVGRHDNFFQLGGDSILILRVAARASERSIEMTPRQMFQAQTPALLARELESSGVRESSGLAPISPVDRSQPLVLSPAQSRQWFLWQFDRESTAYHISYGLTLRGALRVDILAASLEALVQRHETLRTIFRAEPDGSARQIVLPPGPFPLPLDDSGDLTEFVRGMTDVPFDLTTGPLFRAGLFRRNATEHVLVLALHHIVTDGWSMQIIAREFAEIYRARLAGGTAQLDAFPIQYVDYAAWQRAWLESDDPQRQLEYWRTRLGNEHPVLEIPGRLPRESTTGQRVAHQKIEWPASLVQALRRRATECEATLFMVLLTGFQLLLHRHCGESDIRIGVPSANRRRPETQGLVGFCVGAQVLCGQIRGDASLRSLIAQARDAVIGAQEHQELPFEHLVEALQPERSVSHPPLFQVMMNHQRQDFSALGDLPGLTLETFPLPEPAPQFDLTLNTVEDGDGRLHGTLTYAAGRFGSVQMERLAQSYLKALEALATSDEQRVCEVELTTEAEQKQRLEWGVNARCHQSTALLPASIEQQRRRTPTAVALVSTGAELSYAELDERANRLANRLIALGVQPETKVGVALDRSADLVIGLLAVLKAGACYVPLDPAYPHDRLRYMVEDSGIALVLTQSAVGAGLWAGNVRLLEIDTLDLDAESSLPPEVVLNPEQLAYVIYTSGSTGRPKGVCISHAALANFLASMRESPGLNGEDVLLAVTSPSFDIAALELYLPLIAGARIVLATRDQAHDGEALAALIREHHVTVMQATPSSWRLLLAAGWHGAQSFKALCGGEALPTDLASQLRERGVELWNLYGPTETTVWSSCSKVTGPPELGRPISETELHVLAPDLQPAPLGVAGELYIGGAGVARGYWRQSGLTASRFIANPFSTKGTRLYRTGDRARWRPDGTLEYLGRIDHQLKIRGHRIEPGEIEAALLAQSGVREAVVIAREAASGAQLAAYVVSDGEPLDTQAIGERLPRLLPAHMVPAAIVQLPALPLTANGKLDRSSLPAPGHTVSRAFVPPEGETEQALAAIWKEALGVADVGRHDDFFRLGGHSLALLKVQERIEARWSVRPPLRLYFERSSLAAMAELIAECRSRASASSLAELDEMSSLLDSLEA